jgi:hypothetical protein
MAIFTFSLSPLCRILLKGSGFFMGWYGQMYGLVPPNVWAKFGEPRDVFWFGFKYFSPGAALYEFRGELSVAR